MHRPVAFLPFVVALCAAPGWAQQGDGTPAQVVTVQLSSFKFTPATLNLRRGQRYTLRFVNAASGGHDFSAPAFFATSAIAPADTAKVNRGKIDFSGHETVDVTLVPEAAGTYGSKCTHFMHGMFGMKGRIIVQ